MLTPVVLPVTARHVRHGVSRRGTAHAARRVLICCIIRVNTVGFQLWT